ncbi:MAG: DUF3524 domain-containing protein [Calditrichaeota bacterium]|nr:MAG: DUF3524 domain-containing protein [Calditrichota bacterium]
MKILLLEPYFTGSHKAWAEGLAKHSRHHVCILSLSGNFWKWRMHGGAVALAGQFMQSDFLPDLLLASDMLDLTTFLALTRERTAHLPAAVYFHENQLSYPWSPTDRDVARNRDHHYGFINYATALAADAVFFNSRYHLTSFLEETRRLLKHFPDHRGLENVERIAEKAEVLPLGLDLQRFDACKPSVTQARDVPLILWNHRWEFDKNPEEFFRALDHLATAGLDFQVAVLGECFSRKPDVFWRAQARLGKRVVHFGYAEQFADYAAWLWRADILPVTSIQDFFGASAVEALYCNCFPLLPRRLAYPELIPPEMHATCIYADFDDLVARLEAAVRNPARFPLGELRRAVSRFDWHRLIDQYDDRFSAVVQRAEARNRGPAPFPAAGLSLTDSI